MILAFPNLETVRLAIASGALPPQFVVTPGQVQFEEGGRLLVEMPGKLSQSMSTALGRLDAGTARERKLKSPEPVRNWLQILPLVRDTATPLAANTPVLFELTEGGQFSEIAGEMLRLGNDRQAVRWANAKSGTRTLLRVSGPPYYSLLRALEQGPEADRPRAFVERHPRVWVQLGYRHPLEGRIQPPAGKLLLLAPPREWIVIDEGRFQDLYDLLDVALPDEPADWVATEGNRRISVPLRLATASSSDVAELWVLQGDGLAQLEDLVKTADDLLLKRLIFAVAEREGRTTVLVRARPEKQAPPVLVLNAIACRPYLRLPNLFVPCGTRLHPPLRRDAVKNLLAPKLNQLTWLEPAADGRFTPCQIPDAAFRPLADAVEYLLDREQQTLITWAQSATFDFESFVTVEEVEGAAHAPRERAPREARSADQSAFEEPTDEMRAKAREIEERVRAYQPPEEAETEEALAPSVPPSELQMRLRETEQRFREMNAPFDAPERFPLWRELARLNSDLQAKTAATVCWTNALWQDAPSAGWVRGWLASEWPEFSPQNLDCLLATENPLPSQVQGLAAWMLCAVRGQTSPDVLTARLPQIARFLEKHEPNLPVRAAWLGWRAYVELSQGDVLALARARDRLLERLYQVGLNPERDMPAFLRFSSAHSEENSRQIRGQLGRIRTAVQPWFGSRAILPKITQAYADLIFAWALARTGDGQTARDMAEPALAQLREAPQTAVFGKPLPAADKSRKTTDPAHRWLAEAFDARIQQAINGTGEEQLPERLMHKLAEMHRDYRFMVDRLRQFSQILEPMQRTSAYQRFHTPRGEIATEIAALLGSHDVLHMRSGLQKLLKHADHTPEERMNVLTAALVAAPRLGEEFTALAFTQVNPFLETVTRLEWQAAILQHGLFVAAHFDDATQTRNMVGRFFEMLKVQTSEESLRTLEPVLRQSFHGLRKLGMRDEIAGLLEHLDRFVHNDPIPQGEQPTSWSFVRTAQCNLHLYVAAGWFHFDHFDRAVEILRDVRKVLFSPTLDPLHQGRVAATYIETLQHAPLEFALEWMDELFQKVERIYDSNAANSHFQLTQLTVIEAAVRALSSEQFRLDPASRRWLDEDEFLIRRRIHQDVRTALGTAPA